MVVEFGTQKVLLTSHMTRIYIIQYIKQILTTFYLWHLPRGIVMVLRSSWGYNFNHAPHSSQYLYSIFPLFRLEHNGKLIKTALNMNQAIYINK